jgi:hypothetical protein
MDVLFEIIAFLGGMAAIFYGYFRWRPHRDKGELLWCVFGILTVLMMGWDFYSGYVINSTIDKNLLYLSRQIIRVIFLIMCGAFAYIKRDEMW